MAKFTNPMLAIPFTYNKLISLTMKITASMITDLEEFATYNVTMEDVQYLIDSAEKLMDMPPDYAMRNSISGEAEEKSNHREVISETMRSIALRAKAVFGAASAKARAMNAGNITKIRDAELELTARRIYNEALTELEALSKEGLTKEYLDKFDADITAFSLSAENVKSAAINRQLIAEKRQALGAEVYSLLSKYCAYGKIIFAKKSPARYKRYVLQKTKKEHDPEPENEITE